MVTQSFAVDVLRLSPTIHATMGEPVLLYDNDGLVVVTKEHSITICHPDYNHGDPMVVQRFDPIQECPVLMEMHHTKWIDYMSTNPRKIWDSHTLRFWYRR